jgi:hypothetical protein
MDRTYALFARELSTCEAAEVVVQDWQDAIQGSTIATRG